MKHTVTKYQLQHEERKQQILRIAKALMVEKDLSSVTMRDIANACGISRQTLYKYYDSKDAIIFEIENDIFLHFQLKKEETTADLLSAVVDMLYGCYNNQPDDFLFICLFDTYVHTHEIPEQLQKGYRNTIYNLIAVVTEKLTASHPQLVGSSDLRDYFIVCIHTTMGLLSRMAILGSHYRDGLQITNAQCIQMLKQIMLTYLEKNENRE